jgi:RNA polymerase-binding transcription factor DksA
VQNPQGQQEPDQGHEQPDWSRLREDAVPATTGPTEWQSPEVSPADDARRLDEIDTELAAVDAALRRLDDGTYGSCQVCGTPLSEDTLENDPLTTRCAEHAG